MHFKTNFAVCFVASCCPAPKLDVKEYEMEKACNGFIQKLNTFTWYYVWSAAAKLLAQASNLRSLGSDAAGRREMMRRQMAQKTPICIPPHSRECDITCRLNIRHVQPDGGMVQSGTLDLLQRCCIPQTKWQAR